MNSDDTRRLVTYLSAALHKREEGLICGVCPKCDNFLELWGGFGSNRRVGIIMACENKACDFEIELAECEALLFGWDDIPPGDGSRSDDDARSV
jgi:hypothetical protein